MFILEKKNNLILYASLGSFFTNLALYLISGELDILKIVLVFVMPFIMYRDMKYRVFENKYILGLSLLFTALNICFRENYLYEFFMALLMFIIFAFIFYLSNEGFGGADAKSMYFLTLAVGINDILLLLALACVLTLIMQSILKEYHKKELFIEIQGVPFLAILGFVLGFVFII